MKVETHYILKFSVTLCHVLYLDYFYECSVFKNFQSDQIETNLLIHYMFSFTVPVKVLATLKVVSKSLTGTVYNFIVLAVHESCCEFVKKCLMWL